MAKLSIVMRRVWLNLILGAVLLLLVVSCIDAPLGPRDLALLRHHRTQLEATRDHLIADNAGLAMRTQRLQSDDAYLQRLIRRELGYARPDELVYRFPSSDRATDR
jgi:cell division protein FtsB